MLFHFIKYAPLKQRIKEQLHTSAISYTVLCEESAMRPDGSCFNDRDVHAVLKRNGFHRLNENTDKNEWYNCMTARLWSR